MKKRGIITLGAVLAVVAIAVVLVFCNPFGQRRKVAPITDLMVVYVDGGQLVQKGAHGGSSSQPSAGPRSSHLTLGVPGAQTLPS